MFARTWKLFFGLSLGLVLGVAWVFLNQFNASTREMCTRCRAIKRDNVTWGIPTPRIEETAYTRWYKQTQPAHTHHWGWCGTSYRGMIVACGGAHTVWSLPEEIQKEFVSKATPKELASFYSLLESEDYEKREEGLIMAYGVMDLPEFDYFFRGNHYRVDPHIRAAIALQSLGQRRGERLLRSLIRNAKLGNSLFTLCRMLYIPKAGEEFREPWIGSPGYVGGTETPSWPLTPITLVDGVPFLITTGYSLFGSPEFPEEYLKYCIQNCDWNPIPYQLKSEEEKKQALEKLLSSTPWKTPLNSYETEFLVHQIE